MDNKEIDKFYKTFFETQMMSKNEIKNEIISNEKNTVNSIESCDNSSEDEDKKNFVDEFKNCSIETNFNDSQINQMSCNNENYQKSELNNDNKGADLEESEKNFKQNIEYINKENNIPNKSNTFNPEEYVMMMKIGQGNFSEILLVENKNTKKLYAMKQFLRQRIEQLKKQEEVLMEKHVMSKITPHRNVIGFGGSYRDSVNKPFKLPNIY